jgi:hypothetical protein
MVRHKLSRKDPISPYVPFHHHQLNDTRSYLLIRATTFLASTATSKYLF